MNAFASNHIVFILFLFLQLDKEFENEPSGCTAVTALITDDYTLYVGNAGDSRAVISSDGIAIPMSFDHKPGNPGG